MSKHDQSHKDMKYFINDKVYNCPFCNRRHVSYYVTDHGSFDSSNSKTVYFYVVTCSDDDCRKDSFHLSAHNIALKHLYQSSYKFYFSPEHGRPTANQKAEGGKLIYVDILDNDGNPISELDDLFYYNEPSSFFTIDERVPASIRKPLSESYNSLKNNLITGSSAGLRKAIYKLLQHEGIPETNDSGDFLSHDHRIELLKQKYSQVDSELLDELKAIHILTSQELHENDWEDFDGPTIHFLIEVIKEVLQHLYILPDETEKRRLELSSLKSKAKPKKSSKPVK
ncbi:hypothetical protein Lqui_2527 [Legionella quinlivanii]|uniref:DUF4145 domain-containing protein n=1 Tax=Legionella quinlivanii TaxID=45073 RepID=A0A0W0XPI7_9GAMM|nr:hypothetical protein [Legionella quinlivanii]KTD46501.1 hypothetical protein Lqui_2527 [Legionella quinlivanii]SEG50580.1 hypothetical protein SAMN02746093_03183 [Legionella quinlivanii DSM 21216]STY09997.1 Uncharacterised protein [Legionella quinlivanii]